MSLYILGLILGRLLAAYLITATGYLLWHRFRWRTGFDRLHTFRGMSVLSLVFLLPWLADVARAEIPPQLREMQMLKFEHFRVGVDKDPAWHWEDQTRSERSQVLVARSPEHYYPPIGVSLEVFDDEFIRGDAGELKAFSQGVLESLAAKFQTPEQSSKSPSQSVEKLSLEAVQQGVLEGYATQVVGELGGQKQDIYLLTARNPQDRLVIFIASTPEGKLPAAMPALKRIWKTLEFPRSELSEYGN